MYVSTIGNLYRYFAHVMYDTWAFTKRSTLYTIGVMLNDTGVKIPSI